MIDRLLKSKIEYGLANYPAIVLLGPRQVGKTTLAQTFNNPSTTTYLDLESMEDLQKLSYIESYLREREQHLVIIDEIQQAPNLFKSLRVLIDDGRRRGLRAGRFLLLGSASRDVARQAESLAGRVSYLYLTSLNAVEATDIDKLWLRGGFPDSFLAGSEEQSFDWRRKFVTSYLDREVPQFGGNHLPAETLRRLWEMLAYRQGEILVASELSRGLGISPPTVITYVDLLVDLLLVRRLRPWVNGEKGLIKSPRIYLRDSGICHYLLQARTISNHRLAGKSWEGFAIENILSMINDDCLPYFYKSKDGAEIDLLLTKSDCRPWAIEIKMSRAPSRRKGFTVACQDVRPEKKFIVYQGTKRFFTRGDVEAIGLQELCQEVASNF